MLSTIQLKAIFYPLLILGMFWCYFPASGQDTGRKRYVSTEYKFSVEYPKNWRMLPVKDYSFDPKDPAKNNPLGVIAFNSPTVMTGDQKNMAVIMVCSRPFERELIDACHPVDDHLSDTSKNLVVSRNKIKVNGVDAEKVVTKRRYKEVYYYYVSFEWSRRKFFITGVFIKALGSPADTFKYEPEFDRFIESINLIGGSNNMPSHNIKPVSG